MIISKAEGCSSKKFIGRATSRYQILSRNTITLYERTLVELIQDLVRALALLLGAGAGSSHELDGTVNGGDTILADLLPVLGLGPSRSGRRGDGRRGRGRRDHLGSSTHDGLHEQPFCPMGKGQN